MTLPVRSFWNAGYGRVFRLLGRDDAPSMRAANSFWNAGRQRRRCPRLQCTPFTYRGRPRGAAIEVLKPSAQPPHVGWAGH